MTEAMTGARILVRALEEAGAEILFGMPGGHLPDFVAMGEAYGGVGLRCDRAADLDTTIHRAMEIDDAPVVVDFVVNQQEMVWPMIAAGASNDDIRVARSTAPLWDTAD
ncbi:hypothetical protein ACIQGO_10080 [Streptomyces shenzhenensis]|uniref:hypothetical protein n=1 Tax=Streptomyces shenzhenensis TaxID=943815 RepID=UPI0037FBFE62